MRNPFKSEERAKHIPTAVTKKEIEQMAELAKGQRVLEIGSLLGYSTTILAQVASIVHSVDPHEGYPADDPKPTLEPFLKNLQIAGVRSKVVVHIGTDKQVLPSLRNAYFGLAFIDITGLYEDTLASMYLAEDKLTHSGVLCVHDCGHPEWPGAMEAITDFATDQTREYRLVDKLAIFDRQTWG